ncbi:hypothetical protein K456DRAFT_35336 [Colletotrichum gloeosporioides 23]|nr:hypothetical protein K456DRAFT_35336 [Colletotrichum gloeosporioides 23]
MQVPPPSFGTVPELADRAHAPRPSRPHHPARSTLPRQSGCQPASNDLANLPDRDVRPSLSIGMPFSRGRQPDQRRQEPLRPAVAPEIPVSAMEAGQGFCRRRGVTHEGGKEAALRTRRLSNKRQTFPPSVADPAFPDSRLPAARPPAVDRVWLRGCLGHIEPLSLSCRHRHCSPSYCLVARYTTIFGASQPHRAHAIFILAKMLAFPAHNPSEKHWIPNWESSPISNLLACSPLAVIPTTTTHDP